MYLQVRHGTSNKTMLQLLSSVSIFLTCLVVVQLYTQNVPQFYTQQDGECSVIHVALIVSGYNASRDSVVTIKSLLIYRHNRIHFHLIVDSRARQVLKVVMTTWQVPGVNFDLYDIENVRNALPWIFTHYYKKDWTILVPLLHKILPHNVANLVVLNPDLVLSADIGQLWCQFSSNWQQVVGIGWSNWSSTTTEKVWQSGQATRTNPGIMLVNVLNSRHLSWNRKWISAIRRHIHMKPPHLRFREYAIIEVFKLHPDAFFPLSCDWDVHAKECANSSVHLVNRTVDSSNTDQFFSHIHYVQSFDGYTLREAKLLRCFLHSPQLHTVPVTIWTKDYNNMLSWKKGTVLREHPFFLGQESTPRDHYDITMVGYMTTERLHVLEHICQRWEGPISIVVSTTDTDVAKFVNLVKNSSTLQNRTNISYHLLFQDVTSPYSINPLLMLANRNVRTPYIFFNNRNGIPSQGLYQHLKEIIQLHKDDEVALVVPMFQTNITNFPFPQYKQDMLQLISEGAVSQSCNQHINLTDCCRWKAATEPYNVYYNLTYESCIVPSTRISSIFVDGPQHNVSHSNQRFLVVPQGFLLYPSNPSPSHISQS